MIPLPQVKAMFNLSFSNSLLEYSGNFSKLKLKGNSNTLYKELTSIAMYIPRVATIIIQVLLGHLWYNSQLVVSQG